MREPIICDQCKNAEEPITQNNGGYFSKWIAGKKVPVAFVHEKCREKWAEEHGGTIFEAVVP
jgi:hypothetical protein